MGLSVKAGKAHAGKSRTKLQTLFLSHRVSRRSKFQYTHASVQIPGATKNTEGPWNAMERPLKDLKPSQQSFISCSDRPWTGGFKPGWPRGIKCQRCCKAEPWLSFECLVDDFGTLVEHVINV